jgi:hypothetical protein
VPGSVGMNQKNFGLTGNASHGDFERGEDVDLDDAYGNEESDGGQGAGGQDSDDDEGSLYMPTLIAKRAPPAKPKKKNVAPAPIPRP